MSNIMMTRFYSREWQAIDKDSVCEVYIPLGIKKVSDVMQLRVFDLLNLCRINNNRAEEMLICIYDLLYPNQEIDDGIYYEEIEQNFSYREWKKTHRWLDQVTVSDILFAEGINQMAMLRIFDGVTAAFYKSSEYDSRNYRFNNIHEILKLRESGGKEDGNGKTE